ncbi:MAG: hypothetical protein R6X25_01715 [Candidatus Krumholzibacteriia bacterium]
MSLAQPPVRDADPLRSAVLLGLFVGATVGAGFLLGGIPSVELMTLLTALAGAALGPGGGALCGALAMAVHSLANPLGAAVPALLAAQTAGLAAAGALGGLGAGAVASCVRRGRRLRSALFAAALGGGATLVYDVLTNAATVVAFDLRWWVVVTGGLPFALVHVGVNAALFAALFPWLAVRVRSLARASLGGGPPAAGLLLMLALPPGTAAAQEEEVAAPPDSLRPPATARADTLARTLAPDTLVVPGAVADTLDRDGRDDVPADDALAVDSGESGDVADLADLAQAERARRARESRRRDTQFARGWERPLWEPFHRSFLAAIGWETPFLPVLDGTLGAPAVLLREGDTAPLPQILRDGLPQLVGNRLADDPWTVTMAGVVPGRSDLGLDGYGGTAGAIRLETLDLDPSGAVTDARFDQGDHEQNLRYLHILTAAAPWRFGFAFEELIDEDGYDYRPEGDARLGASASRLGEAKFRSGRGFVRRLREDGSEIALRFENLRLNRVGLPAYGAGGLREKEVWARQVALTWSGPVRDRWLTAYGQWLDRDLLFRFTGGDRLLEVARERVHVELARRPGAPRQAWLDVSGWRLHDAGIEAEWAEPFTGRRHGRGAELQAGLQTELTAGRLHLRTGGAALWADHGGWGPEAWVHVGAAGETTAGARWWELSLERGGRAPLSDEVLTPWAFAVPGRNLLTVPEPDLDRETTWRGALRLERRVTGIDLAAVAAVRRLEDGIGWILLEGAETAEPVGTWRNDVDLTARSVTVSAQRGFPFAGWLRLRAAGTWRRYDVSAGSPAGLPPERDARLQVLWENHFFDEDGILQLAYQLAHRGPMSDPWSFAEPFPLPALTQHDVLAGFRLLGTDLSMAIMNVTDQRQRLSAGALEFGREIHLRLRWVFHR